MLGHYPVLHLNPRGLKKGEGHKARCGEVWVQVEYPWLMVLKRAERLGWKKVVEKLRPSVKAS